MGENRYRWEKDAPIRLHTVAERVVRWGKLLVRSTDS